MGSRLAHQQPFVVAGRLTRSLQSEVDRQIERKGYCHKGAASAASRSFFIGFRCIRASVPMISK